MWVLNNGHLLWSPGVLYSEVPLYVYNYVLWLYPPRTTAGGGGRLCCQAPPVTTCWPTPSSTTIQRWEGGGAKSGEGAGPSQGVGLCVLLTSSSSVCTPSLTDTSFLPICWIPIASIYSLPIYWYNREIISILIQPFCDSYMYMYYDCSITIPSPPPPSPPPSPLTSSTL